MRCSLDRSPAANDNSFWTHINCSFAPGWEPTEI